MAVDGIKLRAPSAPGLSRMTSAVLKWLANGVIGLVVASTLWMAEAIPSSPRGAASLMLAQMAASADHAASAPSTIPH
jgi:hypothetical protein